MRQLELTRCGPVFGLFSDIQAEYTNLVTVRSDGTRICSAIRPGPQAPVNVDLAALQLVDAEDDLPAGMVVQLVGDARRVLASNIDPATQIGSRAAASAPGWPVAQPRSGRLRDAQASTASTPPQR